MSLRVVTAFDAQADMSMAERIERMMRECQAAKPNTVLLVWEAEAELEMRCEPSYVAVLMGMIDLAKKRVDGAL